MESPASLTGRCSSGVEHFLGREGVVSSILIDGSIQLPEEGWTSWPGIISRISHSGEVVQRLDRLYKQNCNTTTKNR